MAKPVPGLQQVRYLPVRGIRMWLEILAEQPVAADYMGYR
jgi:hypothetical protein